MSGWMVMRSMTRDSDVVDRKLTPGTTRRVVGYARPFLRPIIVFLVLVVVDAFVMVAVPLLLKDLVDNGVTPKDSSVVIRLSLVVAVLAVFDAGLTMLQRWYSSRIGEGLIYDLRTEVFSHVLRQPIAFFTRAQTGSLVSRLNSDVIGAQAAFTSVLSSVVSNAVSLVLIVAAMFTLSWQLTLGALVLVPFFIIPARIMGKRLAGLSTLQMNLNADMGSRMTERFNVAGALLVKIFGNPAREDREYAERAAKVRDAGVSIALNRTVFMVALGLVAALATAMVYGFGGVMAVNGALTVGTLLALAALLARLYAPLTAISNVRVDIMTALVSFERVFEVLDLQPLVTEKDDAGTLPDGPLAIDVEHLSFRYPSADEVSLASLESTSSGDRGAGDDVLHDVTFSVAPGHLVALVGPSGAGKTTITALVSRLYDPGSGVANRCQMVKSREDIAAALGFQDDNVRRRRGAIGLDRGRHAAHLDLEMRLAEPAILAGRLHGGRSLDRLAKSLHRHPRRRRDMLVGGRLCGGSFFRVLARVADHLPVSLSLALSDSG